MKINRPRILGTALLLALQSIAFSATYYVAPNVLGTGSEPLAMGREALTIVSAFSQ